VNASEPGRYTETAEAAWRWVLSQVRWSDGPWIPPLVAVDPSADEPDPRPGPYRDGLHQGIAGLAHVLAEIRLARCWTTEESELSAAIVERLRRVTPVMTDVSFFDGLSSTVGALVALDAPGADAAVRRMTDTAAVDGWAPGVPLSAEHYRPDGRLNDATLGTASVLLAAVWGMRRDVGGATDLAERAAAILLAEAQEEPTGLNWHMVSPRFQLEPRPQLPNWSHGLAGIAGALALAGTELDHPELVDAARQGAEHLVTLGDISDGGLVVPLSIPPADPARADPISYGWCHGPTGTSLLFLALDRAGVTEVAGRPTTSWYARGRHSVRVSGLPDRLRPGFWDNDGRCCGTAAVGDAVLDAYARTGDGSELAFAVRLGDALVERALVTEGHAYWRFLEHRNEKPLLPPGVGWMQGAAGIAAYLFRLGRVLETGPDAEAVGRMENWWALDAEPRQTRSSGQR
jgi:hypothetical protein